MRSVAAMLLRTLHQRQDAAAMASDASAQLTCNLLCIFGKARQGKSTLMNVMSGVEVSLGYFCFSFS